MHAYYFQELSCKTFHDEYVEILHPPRQNRSHERVAQMSAAVLPIITAVSALREAAALIGLLR